MLQTRDVPVKVRVFLVLLAMVTALEEMMGMELLAINLVSVEMVVIIIHMVTQGTETLETTVIATTAALVLATMRALLPI